MSYSKNKILVIAPHQDDEVLGCGGFIKKNIDDGNSVTILFITSGWSGIKNKKISQNDKIKIREIEAKKAGKILGIKNFIFLRKEDRSIYTDKTLLSELVKVIQTIQPNIILSPHQNDSDFEHKIINKLTKEAAWLAKEGVLISDLPPAQKLNRILFYEVWTPIVKPTLYVDITNQMNLKIEAMKQYESQLVQRNYIAIITGLNMFRGGIKDYKYAEAFQEKIL